MPEAPPRARRDHFLGRIVAVVDDNESVRESLPDLLRHFGFDAHVFSSAEALQDRLPRVVAFELRKRDSVRRCNGEPVLCGERHPDDDDAMCRRFILSASVCAAHKVTKL